MSKSAKARMSNRECAMDIQKKRRATIVKKRELAMLNMTDSERKAYAKRCAASDHDSARQLKQLEALRKVKPDCTAKDIPIARREGWLPPI
jgi:hypothetical protein